MSQERQTLKLQIRALEAKQDSLEEEIITKLNLVKKLKQEIKKYGGIVEIC